MCVSVLPGCFIFGKKAAACANAAIDFHEGEKEEEEEEDLFGGNLIRDADSLKETTDKNEVFFLLLES